MNAPEKFTMKKTLTKADIVEAIYEETDKNRVDVKNVVEQLLEEGPGPADQRLRQIRVLRQGLPQRPQPADG